MKKHLVLAFVLVTLAVFAWTSLEAANAVPAEAEGPVATEAPTEEPVEDIEALLPENDPLFLSCSQTCVDNCLQEEQECKDLCNGNISCEIDCSCDKYWCTDACGCEQDPPPLPCT